MKKRMVKTLAVIVSTLTITGFGTYAIAGMGFGSHMGGYGSNGYHMSGGYSNYNMGSGQHMYNRNHMHPRDRNGFGHYSRNHMSDNKYDQSRMPTHYNGYRGNNPDNDNYANNTPIPEQSDNP